MRKLLKMLLCFSLVFVILAASYHPFLQKIYPLKYKASIEKATGDYNLPSGLLYAVIHTESGFKADAVSSVGARGLMQLTEDTFDWVKYRTGDEYTVYDDMFVPEINIQYGAQLLRLLFDEFQTVENVLCAYHAGWGNVTNWLANPNYSIDKKNIVHIPFPSTAHYQYKVLKAWEYYCKLYNL